MALTAIHGKNAVFYLGAAGAAAINIANQVDWALDMDVAFVDVSSLNQTWKDFVKGMLGFTGTFSGNFDTASTQLWLAAVSNVQENFYLYPNSATMGRYYYGTAWVGFSKIVAGSTTAKASNGIKLQGTGVLAFN